MEAPPPIIPRPSLALWLWLRGLTLKGGGLLFGCSHEQVRAICLPFNDPLRRVPDTELLERIVRATAGEVRPADFYPARLNGSAEADAVGAAR